MYKNYFRFLEHIESNRHQLVLPRVPRPPPPFLCASGLHGCFGVFTTVLSGLPHDIATSRPGHNLRANTVPGQHVDLNPQTYPALKGAP